jgi:MoaA/NifB/PqqE/SkfB family radical SAM enzyme
MLQYKPFANEIAISCINSYLSGRIPILDIEMSALCLHGVCNYCDSPVGLAHPGEISTDEMLRVVEEGVEQGVEWIYICGLGEPLDDPKFVSLLNLSHRFNLGISMFTNIINLSQEIIDLFHGLNINMLVKLDSFNPQNFDKNLGRKGTAQKIYSNLEKLVAAGFGGVECTNLALSIVPTRYTVNDIPDIIHFCVENKIFPSIGEVEYSGKAKSRFQKIALSEIELLSLKEKVDDILGYGYKRQICPSALVGLHLSNMGECVVHKNSGLGCPWFLLTEPEMVSLGNIRENSLEVLTQRVREHRMIYWKQIFKDDVDGHVPNVFGGCGGKHEELINAYTELMDKTFSQQSKK